MLSPKEMEVEKTVEALQTLNSEEDESKKKNEGMKKMNVQNEVILNDDCLELIFSHLSWKQIAGVERVCKTWQGTSYRMWRRFRELHLILERQPLEGHLRRRGESLTELHFSKDDKSPNEATVFLIAKYYPNLEILYLGHIDFDQGSLVNLGQCTKLKKIVLVNCSMFNDGDLRSLLQKCKDVSHLEVKSSQITGECLTGLSSSARSLILTDCPELESRHLICVLEKLKDNIKELGITDCGASYQGEEIWQLFDLIQSLPSLTSLSLCQMDWPIPYMAGSVLSAGLTHLDLSQINGVHNQSVRDIVANCKELRSLNLSGNERWIGEDLTEDGLSLVGELEQLTSLDISYQRATTDNVLKKIISCIKKLKSLKCRGCPRLTDAGYICVAVLGSDLEEFDVSGCRIARKLVQAIRTKVSASRQNRVPFRLIISDSFSFFWRPNHAPVLAPVPGSLD